MKPARYSPLSVLLLTLVFFAIGCRTASPEASPTAGSQTVVEAPTLPAATVEPTSTTAPTATPSPTLAPTETPTPEPTATPRPTRTPEPTATATTPPTATPTAVPPTATPIPLPTATNTPSVDVAAVLRQQISDTIAELGSFRWMMSQSIGHGYLRRNPTGIADCRVMVASYDRIATLVPVDAVSSDPVLQGAQATARQGVELFKTSLAPWIDTCRAELAAGNDTQGVYSLQYDVWLKEMAAAEALLNQAYHMLDQ